MKKNEKTLITVFTPTYNRSDCLVKLYESLKKQNCEFEWLIVDDGSQDNTKEKVESMIDERILTINYIYQENSGKPLAINKGVENASGNWFFIVDSDDTLTENALTTVYQDILRFGEEYELCYRRFFPNGLVIGNSIKADSVILNATEAGKFFNGDLAYVFKTEILKQYPFPKIHGEKFIPELYVWNQVSDKSNMMYFCKKMIYVCDYLEDGYTKNFKQYLKRNPVGFLLFYLDQMKRETTFKYRLKYLIRSVQCFFYKVMKKN